MKSLVSLISSLAVVYYFLFPQHALAQSAAWDETLVFVRDPELGARYEADQAEVKRLLAQIEYEGKIKRSWRVITGYSSTRDQTDSTPFITANGKRVYEGAVATNSLRFGTKLRIPALFGDQVFTVEDRMNARFYDRIDVWFASRYEAQQFGVRTALVEVLPN